MLDGCESRIYSIKKAYDDLGKIDFGDDTCGIKQYIETRLEKNQISAIIEMTGEGISPEIYSYLYECPSTSVEVERSFSMLKKLLSKDRNFNVENIKVYMTCYFNKL